MIDGEGTREDVSEVASPDQFDSFSLCQGPKSDGGDDSAASSPYSSRGESEFERYCSANSVMGTPSMCSSIGTFNDCIDSEFGSMRSVGLGDDSGLENFCLEGSQKHSSSSGVNRLGDRRIEFCKGRVDEEMRIKNRASGLELYDNDEFIMPYQETGVACSEMMPVMVVESGLESLGVSQSKRDTYEGVCSDDYEEGSIEWRRCGEMAENVTTPRNVNAGNIEGFGDGFGNGPHFAMGVEEGPSHCMNCEERDGCVHGLHSQLSTQFDGRETEREEDRTSSKYENSEDNDSMYNYGTDDENRNNLYVQRNREYHREAKAKNENPLLINSSVAFGSEDWDDFEQETGGSTLVSMTLDKFQEQEEQNLENERNNLTSPSLMLLEFPSASHVEQGNDVTDVRVISKQFQVADKLAESINYFSKTSIGGLNSSELEQLAEVKDIPVASYVVQGDDDLAEDSKSSSSTPVGFLKFHEPEQDVRDISVTSSLVWGADDSTKCHNFFSNDVVEKEQDPEAEKSPLEIGLRSLAWSVEKGHNYVDTEEIISIDENRVSEKQELENFKEQLDPLSDFTINQICSHSTESPEILNADFFEHCKPLSSSSTTENIVKCRSKYSPASSSLVEDHPAPVKTETLELNEFYDEVVHDMEEILLDSVESPGAMFSQGNRMFKSQLSLPQRDGGSTASTSGTDDAYSLTSHPVRIDGIEVVGAKQKKGNVSLSERLVGVKEYTLYKIRVWSNKDQWEVERRYRDFFTLYRRLKSLFADQGWVLPSPWSSVEKESRKIFGNASPAVVAERSVLIQECLRSILHSRFFSSPPSALIWFLSPQDSFPSSPASNTLVSRSTFFTRGADTENTFTLGKTISLIVEIQPYKSMKQMLEAQHYTCAGCHKHFDDGMTLMRDFVQTFGWGKPRLCEYTGQLFCSSCHTNETAVLPARVLHQWDFTQYSVSQLAKSYLDSIHDQPMLCVSAVNPFLFSKVPALHHVMGVRRKIGTMLPYVRCPFRRSINKGLGSRRYLLESNDFFALRDLIDLSKGAFAALPVMVESVSRKILEHITEQCLICCDVGLPCSARQACNDPSSLIFPFQEGEVERCTSCGSVFHKPCFRRLTNCHCGVDFGVDEAVGLTKRVSRSAGGEASGALALLGRRSGSGLSAGFLSGLFSKAKPEKVKERKDSDTVILMGSLPSDSL